MERSLQKQRKVRNNFNYSFTSQTSESSWDDQIGGVKTYSTRVYRASHNIPDSPEHSFSPLRSLTLQIDNISLTEPRLVL